MRYQRDDSGLSLIELLVVCALMSVIVATTYTMFGATAAMTDTMNAQAVAGDEAQRAMDRMTMELRQAQDEGEGHGAFTVASADRVQFFVDLTHDGRPERVTYLLVGTDLCRTVASPTNADPPFTFGSPSTPATMVEGVDPAAGAIFCYHGVTVDTVAACANDQRHGFDIVSSASPLTDELKIAMVGINLANRQTSGDKTVTVYSSALARVRSIQNAVGAG